MQIRGTDNRVISQQQAGIGHGVAADKPLQDWQRAANVSDTRRMLVASRFISSSITSASNAVSRLRTFLKIISFGTYSAQKSTASQSELRASFQEDEVTGLVKGAFEGSEAKIETLTKGKERQLIDFNRRIKEMVGSFASGRYDDTYGRPRTAGERSAAQLMNRIKDTVNQLKGYAISEERFESIIADKANRQTLVGFAQLNLLRRSGSINDTITVAEQESLFETALVDAFKDVLKLGVGKPKPLDSLENLVSENDRGILENTSARKFLERIHGELGKIEGYNSPYDLTNYQREKVISYVADALMSSITDKNVNSEASARILSAIIDPIMKNGKSFAAFMKDVAHDLKLSSSDLESRGIIQRGCKQIGMQELLQGKVEEAKLNAKKLVTQAAKKVANGSSQKYLDWAQELLATLQSVKLEKLALSGGSAQVNLAKFAMFLSEEISLMLDGEHEDWDEKEIKREALFRIFEFGGKDSGYKDSAFLFACVNTLKDKGEDYERILRTALRRERSVWVDEDTDMSTCESLASVARKVLGFGEGSGSYEHLGREVGLLTKDQAKVLAGMKNLDLMGVIKELTSSKLSLQDYQAFRLVVQLVTGEGQQHERCRAGLNNVEDGGVGFIQEQMKKLEAITPKECGIELNESKALESLFKKMQLAYAADLVLDGDAAKEKFTQDFQELSKVVDAIADSIIRDHEGKQVAPPDKESLCAKIANKININDLVAMKGNVAVALKNNYVRLFGSDAKFLEQLGKVASEGDIEEMAPAKQGLKSQYDEKLATLKRKVEALGYGNNVCNDLIDTVTKGMGDLKPEMLSLLDPQSVKTVEKCIARMNDRINALEFVARLKQKHEDDFSLGDRPNPDFYALFLKEAEELIVTASVGGLFKSEENVKNFVESRCTSLSVEDRMALKQDVDELSNFTTDANLFKQKVTHMLIRTGEITAKIIQTTGGSVFFDKGRGEIGPDDQIEMYMALFKSLIGPYLDRIFEAAARLGVKNDELSQLDLSSYTVDRRTKFDMQYDQSNAMKLNTWVVQYTGTAFVRLLGQQG